MAVVRWSIEIVIFWEIKRRVGIECDARLEESLTGNGLQVKFVATGGIVRRRIGDAVLVLDADAEAVVAVRVQIADVAATAPDSRTDLLPVAVWAFAHFHVVSDGDARADGDRWLPRQSQVPLVDHVDDGAVRQSQRSSPIGGTCRIRRTDRRRASWAGCPACRSTNRSSKWLRRSVVSCPPLPAAPRNAPHLPSEKLIIIQFDCKETLIDTKLPFELVRMQV